MATGQPTTPKLEIEFTDGVWTDVTADCEFDIAPITTKFGRTTEQGQPNPAVLTVGLDNTLGKYTPGRQVLTDGTTTNPLYPNIQPRKRIRYSYVADSTTKTRFLGYIRKWSPIYSGARQMMQIEAVDRMDLLSRVEMRTTLLNELLVDDPVRLWPFTDAPADGASNQAAVDASTRNGDPLVVVSTRDAAVTFGANGPGYGDGSGARFLPDTSTTGQYLAAPLRGVDLSAFTFEIWVYCGIQLPSWVVGSSVMVAMGLMRRRDVGFRAGIGVTASGRPFFESGARVQGNTSIVDGGWHHIAVTRTTVAGACTLYVDGVNKGSSVGSSSVADPDRVTIGESAIFKADTTGVMIRGSRWRGNLGYAAIYDTALSSTRIAAHFQAGRGYYGDTTDARIKRYLGFAGLTSTDWDLQAGQITIHRYPQGGKDVLTACQDMAESEGGGAAFYIAPSGQARFVNRRFRDSRTPVLQLDAVQDLLGGGWQPSLDEQVLVNEVTANRSAESGTVSTQVAMNSDSTTEFGVVADQVTTYTTSDSDARHVAEYQVHALGQPKFRIPQVTVDLVTAENNLYGDVADVEIGSRIRINNLPPQAAPLGSLDMWVEGWSETYDGQSYVVAFDVTPVDHRWKWDTTDWGTNSATLNASITRTATSLAIATSSGPTFSTSAGSYPVTVQIGEEQITLNNPPGGSSSPQTFTGVTRGANGTIACAQTAGATVTIAPGDGWAL